ncbi:MAG: rod shape-determining protein MreD [Lachnospiraceae bacterium]
MKRYISMFLLIIPGFLLQTTLLQKIKLAGVSPDLLAVLVSLAGVMYGRGLGMYSGILSGILCDFLYSNIIGVYILIYVLTGYISGLAHKIYYKDDMAVPIFIIAASDLFTNLVFYIICFLLRGRLGIFVYMKNIIIPELVYTVIAGIVIYRFLYWLEEKMYPPVEVPLEGPPVQEENI